MHDMNPQQLSLLAGQVQETMLQMLATPGVMVRLLSKLHTCGTPPP